MQTDNEPVWDLQDPQQSLAAALAAAGPEAQTHTVVLRCAASWRAPPFTHRSSPYTNQIAIWKLFVNQS